MVKFKRLFAFILAMLITVSIPTAYATPMYETYEYKENYEYKDEYIAYALKTTVPKIFLNCTAELEYSPVQFDVDLVMEQFIQLYEAYYPQYSEEEIAQALYEHVCNNLSVYLSYGRRKRVETEGSFTGSGVVISDDGYIATNSHVVSLDDSTREMLYISALESGVMEDLENLITDIESYNISLTEEQVEQIYILIMQDAIEQAEIIDEETELVVCFPTADGDTNLDSAVTYKAEVVAEGTAEGVDGLTQDTAIIKIDAENLVALKLSESYPELNSKITSGGFPGASDAIFLEAESLESVLSITVGTGQVSRIVPIEGHDYQAIEINTNISGGNSGGPSVDPNLEIEGLNTYGNGADMRYAYMISAEYVKDLSDDFDIEQGEASMTFLLGLQMLQDGYGKAALECFEAVQDMNPDTPYIEQMIELAENAPQEVPSDGGFQVNIWLIVIIGGILIVTAGIIVTIILVVKSSRKKKAKTNPGYEADHMVVGAEDGFPPVAPPNPADVAPPVASYYNPAPEAAAPVYESPYARSSSEYVTPPSAYGSPESTAYYSPDSPAYNPYGDVNGAKHATPFAAPPASPYVAPPASHTPERNVLRSSMTPSSRPSAVRSAPDPAFKKPTMSSGFKSSMPAKPEEQPYNPDETRKD